MRNWVATWALTLSVVAACTGCGAAETQTVVEGKAYAGWYMQRAGRGVFQACGQERQVRVVDSADLGERSRKFDLQQDTPIYVRVRGTQSGSGDVLDVSQVEQFGSEKPVRDCGMTGVVTSAP